MGFFKDKVYVVTGAGSGMGAATARRQSELGARVVVSDIDLQSAEAVSSQLPGDSVAIKADVSIEHDTDRYLDAGIDKWGRLDGAHLNAGYPGPFGVFAESSIEEFDRIVGVNLRGAYLGLRGAITRLRQNGGGSIVVTASAAGLTGAQLMGAYSASKHGVIGLVRSAALDHARENIRINCVCPGFTDTKMIKPTEDLLGGSAAIANTTPIGRYGTADEIASITTWLLGNESAYATGGLFSVDGGLSAGPFTPPPSA